LLRVGSRWLSIRPDGITEDSDRKVAFHLNHDGTVTIDGVTEEMDLAAERLTRELMQ